MDQNLKMLLTVLVLVVIIVLLLRITTTDSVYNSHYVKTTTRRQPLIQQPRSQTRSNNNLNSGSNSDTEIIENYDPTSDAKFVEPCTSLYSHDIAYLPFTDNTRDAVMMKTNPDKLFDHLADQELGAYNLNDKQFNTPAAMQGLSEDDLDAIKCGDKKRKKHVRFVDDQVKCDHGDDSENDKNNIDVYCTVLEKNNDTSGYGSMIHEALDLDTDDEERYDIKTNTMGVKQYGQMNEDMAVFDEEYDGDVYNITPYVTPDELSKVIDIYRNETLSTIYQKPHYDNVSSPHWSGGNRIGPKQTAQHYD
jgi:uncharacterized protein YxeA